MKLLKVFDKLLGNIETSKTPIILYAISFLFVVTLRIFLETILSNTLFIKHSIIDQYGFYLSLISSLIVLFHLSTRVLIKKISKVLFFFSPLILLAPILDSFILANKNTSMGYLLPWNYDNLVIPFFTFWGGINSQGATLGMRFELSIIIFLSFVYFYIKTKNMPRSILYTFFTYTLLFLYGCMPFVVSAFYLISKHIHGFYLLILLINLTLIFNFYNRKYFIAIIKDIRPFRVLHYELMFILGFAVAFSISEKFILINEDIIFYGILTLISILFSCLFSAVSNNVVDYKIDKISNKNRPLISGEIEKKDYLVLAYIFILISIIFALAVNMLTVFIIALFIGNYFLYSIPPFRLKRIPVASKILITINSFALIILGYNFALITTDLHDVNITLINYIIPILLITVALNFIDIKDYEGDKAEGIKTLPTLIGLKGSKLIIATFFLLSYILIPFYFDYGKYIYVFIVFGILQFYLIIKKKYNEACVFIIYLLSILFLITILFIEKILDYKIIYLYFPDLLYLILIIPVIILFMIFIEQLNTKDQK